MNNSAQQQWRVFHADMVLDFEAMANDMRRCVGISIEEAKRRLLNSKIGDCFLDCVRIS